VRYFSSLLRCGVRFLSPQWLAELAEVARGVVVEEDGGPGVVLQQVVTGTADGEVRYVVRVTDGRLAVRPGEDTSADVTLTTDWLTAVAMARGELGAQDAFMAGRLRVGGDLTALLRVTPALARLGDLFAAVRERTSY
jgi:predicted lipid carrier protein YhbT